jgi:LysM repeat protein
MSEKRSAQEVITNYRKRQQWKPFIIGAVAVLLAVVGIIILIVWLTSPSHPSIPFLSTSTPTPTSTFTPTPVTPTATFTEVPTNTEVPTATVSPTASGPREYLVQEGDTCYSIASKNNVDLMVLMAANNFTDTCPLTPGNKILLPAPGTKLPTSTPVNLSQMSHGAILKDYVVQSGESLSQIADQFMSTVDAIMKLNKITDAMSLQAGQKIDIPVNLITAVPTKAATVTKTPAMINGTLVATLPPTNTAVPAATATK